MNAVLTAAMSALRELSEGVGPVFSNRTGGALKSIRTTFTTACRNANLADVTPHTLRHTFASRLAIAGVGLRVIQELGGRKSGWFFVTPIYRINTRRRPSRRLQRTKSRKIPLR